MRIRIADHQTLTRYVLLFSVFEGDPNEWLRYLESEGSDRQWADDLPFVTWLLTQQERDQYFLEQIEEMLFRPTRGEH